MRWQSPRFFNCDVDWLKFLREKKKKYPTVEKELPEVLGGLTALWILKMKEGFRYSLEYDVCFSEGAQ